jgi:uncharacterized membrane protein YhaH (DUF805 family)
MNSYIHCMTNFVNFNDRLGRRGFAIFYLINFLISLGLAFLEIFGKVGFPISSIYALITLIPVISAFVRRLHDVDKSGWWIFVSFVPIVGIIFMIWASLAKGKPEQNRFGQTLVI